MTDLLIQALLKDMRDEAQAAILLVQGRDNLTIAEDPYLSRALALSLMLIGEGASQMPEAFREANPHLAWDQARGLRNRIAHGYRTVVPDMLIATARNHLPQLIQQIDALLKDAPA
jgi:uncharacterized protein with HEPN domain